MKRRQKKPEGGANWMDTYGDMVTLLLCFFVLLYSISTVDQSKWINFVKSMNPSAEDVSQIVTDSDIQEGTEDVPGSNQTESDIEFDEIYDNLVKMKEQMGESLEIEITKGDGYSFITFRDKVFFGGDSWVLLDEGRQVLDAFAQAVAPSSASIKEIQVLGHTSQGDPTIPNEVFTDRTLSAMRSAVVVAYLQEKNILEPVKYVHAGYGQFRPIDTFDTYEGRARNRRVEILITKTGTVEQSLDQYYDQVYGEGTSEAQSGTAGQ